MTDPLLVGLLGAIVGAIAVGTPSFWGDEAATISASTRSLPDLGRLVSSVDLVHAVYYVMMHGWFLVVPPTEAWSRIPSCLACGGAAAGVVVLTKLLADRPTALLAGVIFAVLPRTTWAAIEARSFAFAALAAVWVTVALIVATRRNTASVWVLYGVFLSFSVVFFVFSILLVPVHCVVVLAQRAGALVFARYAGVSLVTVASVAPFVLTASHQVGQVNWIAMWALPTRVMLVRQYFDNAIPVAWLAVLLVVAAVFGRGRPNAGAVGIPAGAALATAIAWIGIPTAALLLYSAAAQPIYLDRYMTFTVPGMALLLAICVRRVTRTTWQPIGLVALLAVAALPNYLDQRDRHAKMGMDYSDVADLVSSNANAGDCLLLDDTVTWEPAPLRAMVQSRPDAYASLIDVSAGEAASEAGTIRSLDRPNEEIADRLANCNVIWTLSFRDWSLPSHDVGTALPPGSRFGDAPAFLRPAEMGFRIVERWQFNMNQVTRSTG